MASENTTQQAHFIDEKLDSHGKKYKDTAFPVQDDQFRAKYYAAKDDEKRMHIAQDWVASLNSKENATKDSDKRKLNAQYIPTERDIDVILRKNAEKELVSLERFISEHYNLNDPNDVKTVKELWPGYFEKRLEYIEDQLEVQRKIARIKLMGIQTQEDLVFAYAIHAGLIDMPTSVAFDTTGAVTDAKFNRGFFNVKRWYGEVGVPMPTGGAMFGVNGTLQTDGRTERKTAHKDFAALWGGAKKNTKNPVSDLMGLMAGPTVPTT